MIYQLSPRADKKVRRDATVMHVVVAIILSAVGLLGAFVWWFMHTKNDKFTPADRLPFSVVAIAALGSGLAILLLGMFRKRWLRQQRNSATLHSLEVLLMAGLAAAFAMNHLLIPAALFGFMTLLIAGSVIWERRHHRGPADISLSEEGIHLTGGKRPRNLSWWEVEKVMLRHGVLTVEATGNRLFQRHVEPVHFDAGDFEAWCAVRIEAGAEKRRKANW